MFAVKEHILIVDDNQEILDILSIMLTRKSFKISTQSRVGNFIHEIKLLQPNLVIMDKQLGWADGCDLCKLIKSDPDLYHIPVIMFSAYHKQKELCMFAGADAFLQKPFEMAELLLTISLFAAAGTV